jgi:protein gp37
MNRTRIEGVVNADGSQGYAWNPFVGCLNSCPYCWARKCLARSKCELCRKFTPHWHAERMEQPYTLKKPSVIAVCWMGDVWRYATGENVLNEDASDFACHRMALVGIMDQLKRHTFLCLTREPREYKCACTVPPMGHDIPFTSNVWLGVTVTCQEDVDRIGPDFAAVDHPNKFVSYEPMLGEIRDWGKLGKFGWLYAGMRTDGRGRVEPFNPEKARWRLKQALIAARERKAKVWLKDSLGMIIDRLRKETPWTKEGKA